VLSPKAVVASGLLFIPGDSEREGGLSIAADDSIVEVEGTGVVLAMPVAVASDGERNAAGWRTPALPRALTASPSAAGAFAGAAVAKEDSAAIVAEEAATASVG
jgi:hypothetical protein